MTTDYVSEDRLYLWHPFTQTTEWLSYDPIVVERAQGFYLIDTEGREYLDGVSSIWCNVHGHGHPKITAAMKEQVDRVCHSTLLGLSHAPAVDLARKLVEITPTELTRVFYTDSGSTAVEAAVRMAFQYWRQAGEPERTRFITMNDAYHGDTLGSVSLGYSEPFHIGYEPITFEVMKFRPPFLCPPIDGIHDCNEDALEEAAELSLAELEALLEAEGAATAAVVIEPLVQGAAGIWPQPPSFLKAVRDLCDRYGVLLVFDEVATGFGRTGTMFACEHAAVSPDIMCLAKGLTAGYVPVAVTLATERVFEAFSGPYSHYKTLFHGHTYGGNPIGCAAALANIEVFEEEKTLELARTNAAALGELLAEHIDPLAHTGPVRRIGTMVGFDVLADPKTDKRYPSDERRSHRAVLAAREDGVIIRPLADTMVLMPPLTMPPDLLARVVTSTASAIRRVTE